MWSIWKRRAARSSATSGGDDSAKAREQAPNVSSHNPMEDADRLIGVGQRLEDAGQFEAALEQYRQSVVAAPDYPRGHMNMGNALRRLERWEEALTSQRNAIACAPGNAQARFNLALLLAARGERAAAIGELVRALTLDPSMFQARVSLAELYEQDDRYDDAESELRSALASSPAHPGILLNLGLFCLRQGRVAEALESLRLAKHLDPELKGSESPLVWALNYRSDVTPREIADEHFRVGELIARDAGPPITSWSNVPDPQRKLRLGYLSGDFGPHPVAVFVRPVLERHDRSRFEVICYSNRAGSSDALTRPLRGLADRWRDISALNDDEVVERIGRDQIDILVDLSGHTNHNRLSVFARHPAPVQATWLGYLNTTGLRAMDYRITDAHTDPPGETEQLHSERLARMPQSQWCYPARHAMTMVPVPHPERRDSLVFGSFNQYNKLTDRTLSLWARVLNELPEAELVLFDIRQQAVRSSISKRLASHGIDMARVVLRDRVPITEYFAGIGNVDIALDTFPYNGATTTLDVLWMGVPMIALRGDRGIARGSYSIFRTSGLNELIAYSDDEYVDLNASLARDARWRKELRNTLRDRLAASPLMDPEGFTRALEAHFREMWHRWCKDCLGPASSSSA